VIFGPRPAWAFFLTLFLLRRFASLFTNPPGAAARAAFGMGVETEATEFSLRYLCSPVQFSGGTPLPLATNPIPDSAFRLQPLAFSLQPSAFSLQPLAFRLQPLAFSLQPSAFSL